MEKLIKEALEGQIDSANQLVRLYYDEIYVYVYRFTYNKDLALDLTQEIFMRMFKKLHTYKAKKGTYKSWLYKLAHNYVLNYLKSKEYKNGLVIEELPINIVNDELLDFKIINEENKVVLKEALTKLDNKYHEVILLRYYQELSIEDIASILEINQNTVKTRLRRGLFILKETMGGEFNA